MTRTPRQDGRKNGNNVKTILGGDNVLADPISLNFIEMTTIVEFNKS